MLQYHSPHESLGSRDWIRTNDLPLFSLAGLAVVMDNASAEVKAVAHYITLDVDHNGLAAAIEKFLL